MSTTNLGKVKRVLRSLTSAEADELLQSVMALDNAGEVVQRLEAFLVEKGLTSFILARLD